MKRLAKIGILLVLVVLIFAHHFLVHGYLYDEANLISHEVGAAFLVGMIAAVVMWGKDK